MNLIFALFVFTLGFSLWHWVPTYLTPQDMKDAASRGQITLTPGIRIASVDPQGAGARAGVPPQSILLSVENEPVYFPQDVRDLQKGRDLVHYRLRLVSGVVQDVGVSVRDGKTGVTLEMLPTVLAGKNHRLTYAFGLALREAGVTMIQTVSGITHLFTSLLSTASVPEGITGIVGIAQITHVSVQEGFIAYLRLMAVLSLSLAALNILPLPALDGGRLIFVLLEAVRRRPAPRRLELVTNSVGFLLLIALIILVTFNDIRHLL
jgi:regulator of sigma E protease